MSNGSSAERVIDAQYVIHEGEDEEEVKKQFYRTKDKYVAAFLRARGYAFRGMEKVQLQSGRGRKNEVVRFCFDGGNVTRRALFEFYNTDDPKTLTVNGKLVIQELKNVNSLIGNF